MNLKVINSLIAITFFGLVSFGSQAQDDEWSMKTYYMGFLYEGENRDQSEEVANQLQTAHLNYMDSLYYAGKLRIAGPFLDDSSLKGIVIYDVPSEDEARLLADGDPMVKIGRLKIELKPWYGPTGLSSE